ncbi:MAG: RNA polymerase sigma factor [Acidimicrobiia bacterium]
MDDRQCLEAIVAGDDTGLRLLHERHLPWLRARLFRRCADHDLVDQAIQDTFVAVWRSARRYEGRGDVGAWMWGIAIRKLIDLRRATKHQPMVDVQPEPSAEDMMLDLDLRHSDIGTALAQLPEELIGVVVATVIDGLTGPEAAVLLGIPEGTVRSRLHRARQLLAEALA